MTRQATPIAIIGIGALFPRAADAEAYWANIKEGVDAISDVPSTHWRPEDYFDPDPDAPDMTYGRRGGFLDPIDFDPLAWGILPRAIEATDTTQLLGLMVAREALLDAGYPPGSPRLDAERTSVILGVTGTLELVVPLGARLGHPIWRRALDAAGVDPDTAKDVIARIKDGYPEWQEASFPGLLGNVVAGRIANRLDLKGTNCVVDAACGSSLGAVHLAALELEAGRADLVVTGGMDTFNDIFMFMCFSKTPALSPSGDARPFDAEGDGTILGEGLGVVVLKRLEDAERDGDRIYAVIKGIGSSSDGKGNAVYAPSDEGQARALRAAYRNAQLSPDTIELVEAHGTGTRVGDATECRGLAAVYREARAEGTWCALGSVKSMIGHTKAAAGAAGLIKAALALKHRTLPPTLKVRRPNEAVADGTPFYVNTTRRPWLARPHHPRRAALSAFGFGGSNFHCVLEEHTPSAAIPDWDGRVQLIPLSAPDTAALGHALDALDPAAPWPALRVLAAEKRASFDPNAPCRLILVADQRDADLADLISKAREGLAREVDAWSHPRGVFFGRGALDGGVAALFPGQGAQYVGMLRDLVCQFPAAQAVLDAANAAGPADATRLSERIWPFPAFDDATRERQQAALTDTAVAQPAIGAVSLAALRVLESFGLRLDAAVGHSYGELVALCAAGALDEPTLHRLSRLRGALMAAGEGDRGAMLAVFATREAVTDALASHDLDLTLANVNAPDQIVLSGATAEIERAADLLPRQGLKIHRLDVAAAFHSPLVAEAAAPFADALASARVAPTTLPIPANPTGALWPDDPDAIRALLGLQLARPVEFVACIETLIDHGVRTFVEIGPGRRLASLVEKIGGGAVRAVAIDASNGRRRGDLDLARALAELAAAGVPLDLKPWDEGAAERLRPRLAAPRPRMAVSVSGANHVAPKAPRPPRARPAPAPAPAPTTARPTAPPLNAAPSGTFAASASTSTPTPGAAPPAPPAAAAAPRLNGAARPGGHHARGDAPAPWTATPAPRPAPTTPQNTMSDKPAKNDSALLLEAFRATEANLTALLRLQEQTADLHRRFLETQEQATRSFQALAAQQQAMFAATLGVHAPPAEVAAPVLPTLAPAWTPPAPPAAAPPAWTAPPAPPVAVAYAPTPAPLHAAPPATAPAPAPAAPDTAAVLLSIVADKTGYPSEMLELSMGLDADLGIDSIKRVEILSALQEQLPHAPIIKPEHMGSLHTLNDIVTFLGANTPQPAGPITRPVARSPLPAPTPAAPDAAAVLLSIVADKTGYPSEMLELSMGLDADLGIDSIKRVEILSALQEQLPHAPIIKPEHMGSLHTLNDIVTFLGAKPTTATTPQPAPAAAPPRAAAPKAPTAATTQGVDRYVLQLVDATPAEPHATLPIGHGATVAVTGDDEAMVQALAAAFDALGFNAVAADADALPPDLAALVLVGSQDTDDAALLRAFHALRNAASAFDGAQEEGAFVGAVIRLDGAFGFADLSADANVTNAGLAGLARTAAQEWPSLTARVVDLDPALADPRHIATRVATELLFSFYSEIALTAQHTRALQLVQAPLGTTGGGEAARGEVCVISGGARGVTAEVAVALAEQGARALVLLGRTPTPDEEPAWLAEARDEGAIKRALAERAEHKLAPRELQSRFEAVAAAREVRSTLDRLRRVGARALYCSVDVSDAEAVARALEGARDEVGPFTALIHGAGVLRDKRIADKTDDDFNAVLAAKVLGLRALLDATADDPLRLVALFSSSTARFGRRGQCDYAAANEILNKYAHLLRRQRPGCVAVATDWGPWDGGMVTPALKRLFSDEGIVAIGLREGAQHLVAELATPNAPAETVVLGAGSRLAPLAATATHTARTLEVPAILPTAFERRLDVGSHPYLRSHVIDGRAVFPMAMMAEWLAMGALHGNPGLRFVGFDDLRVFKGIILDAGASVQARVCAARATRHDELFRVTAELASTATDGRRLVHARASILLSSAAPPTAEPLGIPPLAPWEADGRAIYNDLLFHGPAFQGLQAVTGIHEEAITATTLTAPPPREWLPDPLRARWIADPLAIDAAFQLVVLWTRRFLGHPSLPTRAHGYRQFQTAFPREPVRIAAHIRRAEPHRALATIDWISAEGALIARLDDYECVVDPSLERAYQNNHLATRLSHIQ